MDDERWTEVGGLRALWRPTHNTSREIEVMTVHDTRGNPPAEVTFPPGTDLADAREHHPNWNRLWDNIRREFWTECTGAQAISAHDTETKPSSTTDYMQWAIVTTSGSCGKHRGPCPTAIWGPYDNLTEAESAATRVTPDLSPHVVPQWRRSSHS